MLKKSFAISAPMLAFWALALGGSVFGQYGGTDFGGGCGGTGGTTNCGRDITHAEAAGLWADYCTETCFDFHAKRHGGLQGKCGKGGCGNSGCGNGGCGNGGCHGCGSVCGTGASGPHGGSAHRLGARRSGDCGCEESRTGGRCLGGGKSGGAACFGYPGGGFGNCSGNCGDCDGGECPRGCGAKHGCGLFGRCGCGSGDRTFGFLKGGKASGLFTKSAANCGSTGAYFSEPVGYEYGTAGITSSVAGCGTNFAAAGCNGGVSVSANQGDSAQSAETGRMMAPPEPGSNAVPPATEPASENLEDN